MNKEQIQERLDTLIKEQEQLKSTLAAYEGAIQDNKWWLQKLDEPTDPEEDKVVPITKNKDKK